jgi:hypothetical protein
MRIQKTGHKTYKCNNYVSVYTNSAKIFKPKNCYLNSEEISVNYTECSMWIVEALATMLASFTETEAGGWGGGVGGKGEELVYSYQLAK